MKKHILKVGGKVMKRTAPIFTKVSEKLGAHSPVILTVVGVVGIVGGTVLACKATKNTVYLLDEYQDAKDDLEYIEESMDESEKADIHRRKKQLGRKVTIDVVKEFVPAILIEAAGITCVLGANHILSKRCTAYALAAAASESQLRKYRDLVKGELGEEKDEHFLTNDKEVEVEDVKTLKNGKEKVVKKKLKIIEEAGLSPYHVTFEDGTSSEWIGAYTYDMAYIMEVENWANARMNHEGKVYLSSVLRRLGIKDPNTGKPIEIEKMPESRLVGWMKNGEGDGFISIRMVEFDHQGNPIPDGTSNAAALYSGFWLDFNVDGVIFDKKA